jgi:hypothetical protein
MFAVEEEIELIPVMRLYASTPCSTGDRNPRMPKDPTNKPVTNKAVASEANLEEEIRRRAYELYEARSREDGQALDDWLRAEAEISAETKFERFGEIKTYRELGLEQGNRSVPLSTLVLLGWRMLPRD